MPYINMATNKSWFTITQKQRDSHTCPLKIEHKTGFCCMQVLEPTLRLYQTWSEITYFQRQSMRRYIQDTPYWSTFLVWSKDSGTCMPFSRSNQTLSFFAQIPASAPRSLHVMKKYTKSWFRSIRIMRCLCIENTRASFLGHTLPLVAAYSPNNIWKLQFLDIHKCSLSEHIILAQLLPTRVVRVHRVVVNFSPKTNPENFLWKLFLGQNLDEERVLVRGHNTKSNAVCVCSCLQGKVISPGTIFWHSLDVGAVSVVWNEASVFVWFSFQSGNYSFPCLLESRTQENAVNGQQ